MLFNSFEFIFLFLPLVLVGYWLTKKNQSNAWLYFVAFSSLFFYAYWNPKYISVIIISIIFNYGISSYVRKKSKPHLIAAITANLGSLFYFKYVGLFTSLLNYFSSTDIAILDIILPIGISFFTFQQIAFQVDTYYQKVESPSFINYIFFVTFFPQLIAGPIVHHSELFSQLKQKTNQLDNICVGLSIFSIGLFKKVIIADSIAKVSNSVFNSVSSGFQPNFIEAWYGALAYSLQIYFDFSAYSDMAIGLGLLFGLRLPQNFSSPYQSLSIQEFWRRWHITLSRFIRDYLYIPLGGNRCGKSRKLSNLLITMGLAGLWHGASLNFVFWGVLHGLLLILHAGFGVIRRTLNIRSLPNDINWLLTMICLVFAWVPFRASDFSQTLEIWKAMVLMNGFELPMGIQITNIANDHFLEYVDVQSTILILFLVLISKYAPNVSEIFSNYSPTLKTPGYDLDSRSKLQIRWKPNAYWALIISALFLITIGNLGVYSEFLYFQF